MADKTAIDRAKVYALKKRELIRDTLNPFYQPFYDNLCIELEKHPFGQFWAPYKGYRSFKEQQKLYEQGRSTPGKIITEARAGDSAHNWGCATDWCEYDPDFIGAEVFDKARWDTYKECVRAAGLVWGGDWKSFPDKPHNELKVQASWGEIGRFYRQFGELKTMTFINNNIVKGIKNV